MLRILPALAVLVLGLPATASAAPFGEVPFLASKEPAFCLKATGAPGELLSQTRTTAAFATAGAAALTPGGVLPIDGARGCAEVAGWPGGGGVMAFGVESPADREVWVRGFLREPGRDWSEPIDIMPPEDRPDSMNSTVAASERGDALVATSSVDARGHQRVRVARRLPGGGFGASEQLALTRTSGVYDTELHAGYAASGEAIVTWAARGPKENVVPELWAAIAPPGAPFGAPQRIGSMFFNEPYALAVGADGRALAVYTSFAGVVVAERAPGAAFGTPITLGRRPAAQPRAGGRAATGRRGGRGLDDPVARPPDRAHARAGRRVRTADRARHPRAARG